VAHAVTPDPSAEWARTASRVEVRRFTGPDDLAEAAAREFDHCVADAVRDRGVAFVALSGGSTPRLMYRRLAAAPFRGSVPWPDVEFFWSDERAVPPDHPDSNFGMARAELLGAVAAPAQLHRMEAEREDRDAAAHAYGHEVRDVLGLAPGGAPPRFDLILLGLGPDGHTASLFPGSPALEERERWVVAAPGPRPDSPRMTMTLPLLNRARRIVFLVAGKEKAAVLRDVLRGAATNRSAGTSRPDDYPAARIAPDEGRLLWLVDEAAATELDPPAPA